MVSLDVIKNITIRAKTEGVDTSTAQLRLLQGGLSGVAGTSEQTTRSTLSVDAALARLRRSVDQAFRSEQQMAAAERTLNAARAQGLITLEEQNRLLALASVRYKAAGESSQGFFAALGGIKSLLGGLGIGLGISELAKIPGVVGDIVHQTAGLQHTAETIGITTTALQELEFAGREFHVSTETMDSALERFSKNLGIASTGSGELFKILSANHVKISGDVTKDFLSVANLIERTTNAEQRNLITTTAFGRNAEEMGLLFTHGAAGVRQAADEIERMGGVISPEMIERIAELDRRWTAFTTTLQTKFHTVVLAAVDELNKFAGAADRFYHGAAIVLDKAGGLHVGPVPDSVPVYPGASGHGGGAFGRPTVLPDQAAIAAAKAAADAQAAAQKQYDRTTQSVQKQIDAQKIEIATLGMTTEATARYRIEQQLLNDAKDNGIKLSVADRDKIAALADTYAKQADQLEKMQERYRQLGDVAQTVTGDMQTAFSDFVDTNKFKFKDMVDSILKDLAKLAFQQAVTGPLTKGLTTALNSALGTAGTAAAIFHDGGTVGQGGRSRIVDPAHFDHAPRYHNGIDYVGGERPAILKVGERVVAAGQNTSGSISAPVNISINAAGADPATVTRLTAELSKLQADLPNRIVTTIKSAQSRRQI